MGGLWGLLFGSALFVIPGIGPLIVFGPLVGWIVGALEGAVVIGSLSAFAAALYGIGIPKDSLVKYETAVKSAKFLVIAHGTAGQVAQAKSILDTAGAEQTDVIQGYAAMSRVKLELSSDPAPINGGVGDACGFLVVLISHQADADGPLKEE